MTYNDFQAIWLSALEYTHDQHDLYIAERGWQTWMDEYGDDTQAIIDTLDVIYAMAHGGVKSVRAETGLSQAKFAMGYGIPRRTLEDWERGINDIAPYVLRTLAFAVFSNRREIREVI